MSDTAPDKFCCNYWRCDWHGTQDQSLSAPDPFNSGDMIYACPECKDAGDPPVRACDEIDCWEKATCGTPVDDERRYVHVCSKHFQRY